MAIEFKGIKEKQCYYTESSSGFWSWCGYVYLKTDEFVYMILLTMEEGNKLTDSPQFERYRKKDFDDRGLILSTLNPVPNKVFLSYIDIDDMSDVIRKIFESYDRKYMGL